MNVAVSGLLFVLGVPLAGPTAASSHRGLGPVAAVRSQDEPAEGAWPRVIEAEGAEIVIYQPQAESFAGPLLTGRAAVSVVPPGAEEPMFGVVWFEARVETDRAKRTVRIMDVAVSDARCPNVDDAKLSRFARILTANITGWTPTLSLDRLLAMLELVELQRGASGEFVNDPPRILFVTHPATLVTIDGEPRLNSIPGSKVRRVVNTPYLILFDPSTKAYYLTGGAVWLASSKIGGPWTAVEEPPEEVASLITSWLEGESLEGLDLAEDRRPEIIVVTQPTELISTDGKPAYSPIGDSGLLYVTNTESDVFLEIDTQRHFVLLAGRWYGAESTDGPWAYVPPHALPRAFAGVPPGSTKGHVLASVAGTDQAADAVRETYVPQTGAIGRDATVDVEYDGEPKFEEIEGTELWYAVNTSYFVLRHEKKYYCCHEAVWFVANDPLGPWAVCAAVPDEIYAIPPSSPVYGVTYVYVYDSTPEVVYVGYTPGYVGCYVDGVVVYGTGWVYRPWYRRRYYARPHTWGFAFRYNRYTGAWGVGYRGYHGGIAMGHSGGWWGVGGCKRWGEVSVSRTVYTPVGTFHSELEIDRKPGKVEIDREVSFEPNENIYERRENRDRNAKVLRTALERARGDRGARPGDRARSGRDPGDRRVGAPKRGTGPVRKNDLVADRNGNVHRRTPEGWQRRNKDGWSPPTKSPDAGRRLEDHLRSRERGTQRTQEYQRRIGSHSGARRGVRRR